MAMPLKKIPCFFAASLTKRQQRRTIAASFPDLLVWIKLGLELNSVLNFTKDGSGQKKRPFYIGIMVSILDGK